MSRLTFKDLVDLARDTNSPTLPCETCEGSGEIVTGQAADGCIHTAPCPNPLCDDGDVPNDDFNPEERIWWR